MLEASSSNIVVKQTLVAVVALQYFCGSGHTISNAEAKKSIIMMIICIFLRIIRLQKQEILSSITNFYLLLWKYWLL